MFFFLQKYIRLTDHLSIKTTMVLYHSDIQVARSIIIEIKKTLNRILGSNTLFNDIKLMHNISFYHRYLAAYFTLFSLFVYLTEFEFYKKNVMEPHSNRDYFRIITSCIVIQFAAFSITFQRKIHFDIALVSTKNKKARYPNKYAQLNFLYIVTLDYC